MSSYPIMDEIYDRLKKLKSKYKKPNKIFLDRLSYNDLAEELKQSGMWNFHPNGNNYGLEVFGMPVSIVYNNGGKYMKVTSKREPRFTREYGVYWPDHVRPDGLLTNTAITVMVP